MPTRVNPTPAEIQAARKRYHSLRTYRLGTSFHYLVEGEDRSLCGKSKDQMTRNIFPYAAASCRSCQASGARLISTAQRSPDGE